ncbi:MAG TPA: tetratricopeptide repeat protein [Gaiellaceae bacterium]|jgi:predicted ATPase/class 3 adenylate cyclase|nr:tetratricopeptide repeat protein [Gaiellaceae bacterium]
MAIWTCQSCGGENPEGTRFCGHCGASAEAAQAAPTLDEPEHDVADTLRSFVAGPVAERLIEAGGEIPEERRLITALFADVSGFTALADRLDPEELLEVIDPVIAGLSSIVGRYEGYVEKFAGDALLALFGAPVTHEDDAARALIVALEMHAELERICGELPYDAELTLHAGVNSGHGVARILGSEARMDYSVLGDSVILAQRLESAAPTGETYVGELTKRLTDDMFEFEPVGELTLKGKAEPVPAWRLLGRRTAPALRASHRGTTLVGRDRELAAIGDVLGALGDGLGGIVTVTGEPGVGKSRLSEAVEARAGELGLRWLKTRCLSYGASLAYWPYAELVRSLANLGSQDEPEQSTARLADTLERAGAASAVPFFARLLGLPGVSEEVAGLNAEAFRRGLHAAFATTLVAVSKERPLVVALEDAHWLDGSSSDLTRELAQLCEREPLALYLIARPEAGPALAEIAGDKPRRAIALEPLDEDGVAALVRSLLAGDVEEGFPALVRDRTAGNPLFVEELLRSLQETGALARQNGTWHTQRGWDAEAVPPTIEELLAARIDLLSRSDASILQTASVIGRRVQVDLLEAVTNAPELDGALRRLVAAGFLDPLDGEGSGRMLFHHALVQDVAYSRLLRRRRRDLHRQVAEVAEAMYGAGDEIIDLLARHLYLGEAGAKAVDYLVRAGERSMALYANDEAIVQLTRAAEVVRTDGEVGARLPAILLDLAELHELVGDYEEALELYAEVRAVTHDVRAWRGLASVHRRRGEYEEALAVIDEAIAADELRGQDLAPLWLQAGWSLALSGRIDQAIDVFQAGLEALGPRTDSIVGQLLAELARTEGLAGRLEDALAHLRQAQAIFEELSDERGLATTLRILGDVQRQAGRLDESVAALRRGLELAERVGSVEEVGGCLINIGVVEERREAFQEAIECDRRAIEEFERIGHGSGRARGYANLAYHLMLAGDYDESERWCERTLELSRAIGYSVTVADAIDTIAAIEIRRGNFTTGAERAEEAAELYLEMGAPPSAAQSLELARTAWEQAGDSLRARAVDARARSVVQS